MHIGLLECDQVDSRFRPIAGGYPEMFGALLAPHLAGIRWSYFDVCHGQLPAAADVCDGYVCTGSRFSVYERLDWIEALKGFVRRLAEARKPFVGICFGHQLLAEALGGKVCRSPDGWGVGVQVFSLLRKEDWMRPPLERCRLQHMHQDQVQKLPGSAVLLGSGEHCEVALFSVHGTMLGIEGHPEFPPAYNRALIEARVERIGTERARAALEGIAHPTDEAVVGGWIAEFLRAS